MPLPKMLTDMFGIAALAGMAAAAVPAAAQQARYCNGALVANAFYSDVQPAAGGADVAYHGQFQNQDPQRRAMTATMLRIVTIGRFTLKTVIDRFDLAPYEQKDINLLTVHTEKPSGEGAPKPANIGSAIRFVCTYR